MAHRFCLGQRWVSETEPELGLGTIQRLTARTVSLWFGATRERREYAVDNLPIRRVRFQAGDSLQTQTQKTFIVRSITERQGLLFYKTDAGEVAETELCDSVSFNRPEQRLAAGQVDSPELFELRRDALNYQYQRRKSPVRGFVGGRVELIPHQLFIAAEVSGRLLPRVLLADEVGLGKTIEACLIVHRLLLTGRAQRVLVLVPESLVHQWFVELLRRFNLWFHIFDEERCAAIEGSHPETNPFLDDQWVLASLELLTRNGRRGEQAVAAGWDLVVVDEAHHLGWSPTEASPDYAVVNALGRSVPGLLLLTATPEQLGMASHFARLRLLDPDRFYDLDEFIQEAEGYRQVAQLAEVLPGSRPLTRPQREQLTRVLVDPDLRSRVTPKELKDPAVRAEIFAALLDQHGTGRVMFRNTRTTIAGFQRRRVQLYPLTDAEQSAERSALLMGAFVGGAGSGIPPLTIAAVLPRDPRIEWLVALLRELGDAKVLLLCRTRATVEAIEAAVRACLNVKLGMFHEGLTLVQRDRNAAWFAEADGARMLICSEIGSEGRNFQFAHHLVMFDLPLDPELLEQRIGRLDRIGQTEEIRIHVPYIVASAHEVLARWYHIGLNSLAQPLQGGRELWERFGDQVIALAGRMAEPTAAGRNAALDALIQETQVARDALASRLEQGRDRLLELTSFRAGAAQAIVADITTQDQRRSLDEFMLAIWDEYSIPVEELGPRVYRLGSAGVFAESFPGLPADGFSVTTDRRVALRREEIQFLTWDHPLATGALDLLLGSEKGNCSFAQWPDPRTTGLYLEVLYVLECLAPPPLQADRFLPPTPIRMVVDHAGKDATGGVPADLLTRQLRRGDFNPLWELAEITEDLIPGLLRRAEQLVQQQVPKLVAAAQGLMTTQLGSELERLRRLQKVNRTVRNEEIETLDRHRQELAESLQRSRLRVDAIRLIQRGPV